MSLNVFCNDFFFYLLANPVINSKLFILVMMSKLLHFSWSMLSLYVEEEKKQQAECEFERGGDGQ